MATYYCNASGSWAVAQDGTDHTGSEWQGPYGLQKAFDTVTAGNDLYIKGTANLTRLVSATLGDAGGWSVGDEVQNDIGDGDDWTGILCEVSGNNVVIELDVGYTVGDIDTGDGIENTTSPDTTTIASPACNGVIVDTQSGDTTNGFVQYIGVNDSWTVDGTKAIFDGNDDATNCIKASDSGLTYLWFQNIAIKSAFGDGLNGYISTNDYWVFIGVDCYNNGDDGFFWTSGNTYMTYIRCKIYNNSGMGINSAALQRFLMCAIYGNGGRGLFTGSGNELFMYSCAVFDNGDSTENCQFDSGSILLHCVLDGTNQTGEQALQAYGTTAIMCLIMMCRLTNCAVGLDAANALMLHGWNLYYNNTNDTANAGILYAIPDNDTADTNQYDPDVDDGYNDAGNKDYNLKSSRTYNGDGNDTIGLGVGS